jgi:integrase/recombinase XerC
VAITRFFVDLRKRGLSASSIHQAYRTLKTFCRWLVATGALGRNPMVNVSMRTPTALPQVPTEDELRAILAHCPSTLEGARNRALVLVMADAGLRAARPSGSWWRTGIRWSAAYLCVRARARRTACPS